MIKIKFTYPYIGLFFFFFFLIACEKGAAKDELVDNPSEPTKEIKRDSVFVKPSNEMVVEGYLTLSEWYAYSYDDIDYSRLTHISYGFLGPTSETDATLEYEDKEKESARVAHYNDLSDKTFLGYGDRLIAKAHAHNVKVLIALAGAAKMKGIFASKDLRTKFVDNLVILCEERGYDGIALDYEYPYSSAETKNILEFCIDLRIAFLQSATLSKKQMVINLATPVGDWVGVYYDYTALAKCVDWFSPMTYEYGDDNKAVMNAPLYKNTSIGIDRSVHDAVNYFILTRNINPLQVVVGVPFYGWQYTTYTALGATASGWARATKDMYNEYISQGGFVEKWDDTSMHSYYVKEDGSMMIVYDNDRDLETKAAYIKSKGLKGAMIWELSRGGIPTNSDNKNPWLKTLGDHLLDD